MLPVILMTAFSTIENAVEAMKLGAFHYVNKPFNLDDVMAEKALETLSLRREVVALRSSQGRDYGLDAIVGASPAMTRVKELLGKVAAAPERRDRHREGPRGQGRALQQFAGGPAVRQRRRRRCRSSSSKRASSAAGAFTDARQQKRGLFETADGGTVFLDEIGEMTPGLQAKLLALSRGKDVQARRRPHRHPRGRPGHREPQSRGRREDGQVPRGFLSTACR